jgi:hypothetical protein
MVGRIFMTSSVAFEMIPACDGMRDVLSRVWQLDPTIEEAAVRGYVREMAEAEAVLDTVDLSDVPLSISFSPSWPEGTVR